MTIVKVNALLTNYYTKVLLMNYGRKSTRQLYV